MKNLLIILLSLSVVGFSTAQTKLIYHKSHSGSTATFKKTLEDAFFGGETSNFGAVPWMGAEKTLDTVYIKEGKLMAVATYHCTPSKMAVTKKDGCFREHFRVMNFKKPEEKPDLKSKESIKSYLGDYMKLFPDYVNTPEDVFYRGFDREKSKKALKREQKKLEKAIKKAERKKKKVLKKYNKAREQNAPTKRIKQLEEKYKEAVKKEEKLQKKLKYRSFSEVTPLEKIETPQVALTAQTEVTTPKIQVANTSALTVMKSGSPQFSLIVGLVLLALVVGGVSFVATRK